MIALADHLCSMARNNLWSNHRIHQACAQLAHEGCIRDRGGFKRTLLLPMFKKMGISNNAQVKDRLEDVKAKLSELTLKQAFENLGYRYDEELRSHKPVRGSLAMANSGPNTNGSQFFINLIDTPWLIGKHTVFGKVIEGMDIVDKIGAVKVSKGSKPMKAVKILSIRKFDYATRARPGR